MAYRALYREWRPRDFSHMVGQKAIISTLRNQVIAKRIGHAYLFCGSRGTGKTSTAKILAKAINCLNPVNGDPCGECANCIRAEQEETLDIIEIDAASNNGVDEIRNLRDTVKYPPQYGNYKVYIIDEVHMLSPAAFNALLKTLEEPPAHIVFILATTEPQKLPETILSRCQRFDFGRIRIPEIAGRLKEAADGAGAHVTDGALMLIARAAEGGMRDALSILDMCLGYNENIDEKLVREILGTSDAAFLFEYSSAMAEKNAGKIIEMIDRLMRNGKDPVVFAKDVCRHVRTLLIARTSPEDMIQVLDITEEEAAEYKRQGEEFTVSRLIRILDLYMALESEMRYSSTPRIALESTAVKSCLKLDETDDFTLNDRIAELEKKIDELTVLLESGASSCGKTPVKVKQTTEELPDTKKSVAKAQKQEINYAADDPAVWKDTLAKIRSRDITAWSFLAQGEIVGSHDRHFQWRASRKEGEKQFIAALNKAERNKIICECLRETTGEECSFTAIENGSVNQSHEKDGDAFLETIIETFGREPVKIVDEIK